LGDRLWEKADAYQNFHYETIDRWNENGRAFPGVTTTRTQPTVR
jgi:hypothetical protein